MKRARDEPLARLEHARKRRRLLTRQTLSIEQRELLEDVVVRRPGRSVFITGGAGSGKSHVLRAIIERLEASNESVFVTASTGLAASEIGGRTIHSFGGIGLGADPAAIIAKKIMYKDPGRRWKDATTLVIDEISMLSAETFDLLDTVARLVRRNDAPFGGIRLVLCGDLFQCPPVTKHPAVQRFIFESQAWAKLDPTVVDLAYSFRQSQDPVFSSMLAEVRRGQCNMETEVALSLCVDRVHPDDALVTTLMAHNAEVDAVNEKRLAALPGPSHVHVAIDYESTPLLLKSVRIPARLELKVGAQVMLLKNLDIERKLFNGAVGQVVSLDEEGMPLVKFATREEVLILPTVLEIRDQRNVILASRHQLPLALSWAMTIHKSQGQTISSPVVANLDNIFDCGMAYVMLSRLCSLSQLSLKAFSRSSIKAHPKVIGFYDDTIVTSIILLSGSADVDTAPSRE